MKVAVGQALPCPPDARWHGNEIPPGYAKVTVDEIVTGFQELELDIPGLEDERTLGEVLGGVIVWDKNYIELPCSAPRITPPPSRRRSPKPPSPQRSPPHDYGHQSASPSLAPPPPAKCANAPSMSSNRRWSPPRRKLLPLPKLPHQNFPIRTYDVTNEENDRIAKEHYEA
jgi:hypothetical protein